VEPFSTGQGGVCCYREFLKQWIIAKAKAVQEAKGSVQAKSRRLNILAPKLLNPNISPKFPAVLMTPDPREGTFDTRCLSLWNDPKALVFRTHSVFVLHDSENES
jgi:hypothetical protein